MLLVFIGMKKEVYLMLNLLYENCAKVTYNIALLKINQIDGFMSHMNFGLKHTSFFNY
jgi:hypothetical protein